MTPEQVAKRFAPLIGALMFLSPVATALTLEDLHADIDAGDYAAAAEHAHTYLQTHPGNRDARFLRARALAGQGQTDKAVDAFQALAADYPLRAEPANNIAVLYADQGKYDKAREWLEKALATQPAYATAHRNLGDIYTALADLAYRKALSAGDMAAKTPLTMVDRFYYAQESVAPTGRPAPAPPRPKSAATPEPEPKPEPQPQPQPQPATKSAPAPSDKPEPAPVSTPADDNRSIVQTVRAWALAWSSQDYETYADFYADNFDPGDNLGRDEWRDIRRDRLENPETIEIRIEDPEIERVAGDRARVNFVQHYDSPRYSDRVNKQLLMQRTRAGWRILRETSVAIP